jgi:hypothetical protein
MLSRGAKGSGGVVHIVMKIRVPKKLILATNPDVLVS